jgi:hypothetical protein
MEENQNDLCDEEKETPTPIDRDIPNDISFNSSMEEQNSSQSFGVNGNELISSDFPFTGQELRDILLNVLNIRCSYPLFPSQCYGSTIRCILELNEEIDQEIGALKKFESGVVIEDVICKVMPKLSSRRLSEKNLMFTFPLKKPSVTSSSITFPSSLIPDS